jgi:hypothetical protein
MAKKKLSHAEWSGLFERRMVRHDQVHKEHEASRKKMFDEHTKARQEMHDRQQATRRAMHEEHLKSLPVENKPNPLYDNKRSAQ